MNVSTYYERRLAAPGYRASRERKAELIFAICGERLRSARRVVDLGAGTGLVQRALERLSGRPIVGFEIDRAFIEAPERMAVADLERLPVRDETIDLGIANHVYEHVADLERFFAELRRALAPGGRIYLTAGNRFAVIEPHYRIPTLSWWPRSVATALLKRSGRGARYDDIRFTTHRHLTGALARHGFTIEDLTDRVLATEIDRYESRIGRALGRAARALPGPVRRGALSLVAPQWFFLIRRADEA